MYNYRNMEKYNAICNDNIKKHMKKWYNKTILPGENLYSFDHADKIDLQESEKNYN